MVLSKHYSRKAVIEAAKQAGIRWRELSHAEISARAQAYCEAHKAEMIAKALWAISRSPRLQRLAEQERKRRLREKGLAKQANGNAHSIGVAESQR
jgi:hypothetical protein